MDVPLRDVSFAQPSDPTDLNILDPMFSASSEEDPFALSDCGSLELDPPSPLIDPDVLREHLRMLGCEELSTPSPSYGEEAGGEPYPETALDEHPILAEIQNFINNIDNMKFIEEVRPDILCVEDEDCDAGYVGSPTCYVHSPHDASDTAVLESDPDPDPGYASSVSTPPSVSPPSPSPAPVPVRRRRGRGTGRQRVEVEKDGRSAPRPRAPRTGFCPECHGDKANKWHKRLDRHMIREHAHAHKPLKCPMCPKTFKQTVNLERHKQRHPETKDPSKVFPCACGKILSRKDKLKEHRARYRCT